jgi:hypothetical protein
MSGGVCRFVARATIAEREEPPLCLNSDAEWCLPSLAP